MPKIANTISTYILAKDTNRPWLMPMVFSEQARLVMDVRTDAIAFPSAAIGLSEITETLVRRFGSENENVYTFCLTEPPKSDAPQFVCNWLVGMTRKDTGQVRIGCGVYNWTFPNPSAPLAGELNIVIEVMESLDRHHARTCLRWLSGLPYPWCPAGAALQGIPPLSGLSPIRDFLVRAKAG